MIICAVVSSGWHRLLRARESVVLLFVAVGSWCACSSSGSGLGATAAPGADTASADAGLPDDADARSDTSPGEAQTRTDGEEDAAADSLRLADLATATPDLSASDASTPDAPAAPDAGTPDAPATPDASTRDAPAAPDASTPDASTPDAPSAPDAPDAAPDRGPPDVACRFPEDEICDGQDNDCDGVVDDGEVCPDTTVRDTLPFTDGIYVLGTTHEGLAGNEALQRFWPTRAPTYYADFEDASHFVFRLDGQLHYRGDGGIFIDDKVGSADTLIRTPPCGEFVDRSFGFDAAGVLHYRCFDTLRRGNGERLATIADLVAVLADGRVVVQPDKDRARYAVVTPAGQITAELDPAETLVGYVGAVPRAATVIGNNAFVMFERVLQMRDVEFVVYRLDESSRWHLVRRLPLPKTDFRWSWALPVSDGTVFVLEDDPTTTFDMQIVAFRPDGTYAIVWREVEAPRVRIHGSSQLVIGPLTPSGPSLLPE